MTFSQAESGRGEKVNYFAKAEETNYF